MSRFAVVFSVILGSVILARVAVVMVLIVIAAMTVSVMRFSQLMCKLETRVWVPHAGQVQRSRLNIQFREHRVGTRVILQLGNLG